MYVELTERQRLEIENQLLREMAARYARLIEIKKENASMEPKETAAKREESRKQETVRIMMTVDGIASHQRKGLVLEARVGECRGETLYWIHWAGHTLAVDDTQCVLLDEHGTPIPK